ncbi:MAG: hypothetical protein ACYC10_05640 [Allorhizobium sp.]
MIRTHIAATGSKGALLIASIVGQPRPPTNGDLLRVFTFYPLMTLKVMAGLSGEPSASG